MPTKKSLLLSLKGIKITLKIHAYNSAVDITKDNYGETTRYTITQVGDELFEVKDYKGEKEYFSMAHIRHIAL
jgi:hypothetical protein